MITMAEINAQLRNAFPKFNEMSAYDRVVKARLLFPMVPHKQLAEDVHNIPYAKYRKHIAKAKKSGDLPKEDEQIPTATTSTKPSTTNSSASMDTKKPVENGEVALINNGHSLPDGEVAQNGTDTLANGVINKSDNSSENEHTSNGHNTSDNRSDSGSSSKDIGIPLLHQQHMQQRNQYKCLPSTETPSFSDKAYGFSIGDKVVVAGDAAGGEERHAVCECFDMTADKWRVRYQSDFTEALVRLDDVRLFESHCPKPRAKVVLEHKGLVTCVERLSEFDRNGNKLKPPKTENCARPNRLKLPYLYPERPSWSVDEGKELLTSYGVGSGLVMHQKENDAKWRDFIYVSSVSDCHIKDSQETDLQRMISLKEWNRRLEKAGYKKIRVTSKNENKQMQLHEFMKTYGFPQIDQSKRDVSQIGLTYDFVPQECDYCGVRATSLPVCECGESYCSPACRLAEWKNHKEMCEMALENMFVVNLVDQLWLLKKGYVMDCEGTPITMKS